MERTDFEYYMQLDPSKATQRCFIENRCVSLAQSLFLEAQQLELLRAKLETK